MEHKFIKHVEVGEAFEGIYYLDSLTEKIAKNSNKYSDLILRDSSGSSLARFWGELKDVEVEKFLACKIEIEEYNSLPQIIIKSCGTIDAPEDLSNYVSISPSLVKDKETLQKILKSVDELCDKSQNKICSSILRTIFTDSFLENFINAPYGVLPFYGRKGGLLAHAVRVATVANDMARTYQLTIIERAILLSAALLQSIGGMEAYEMNNLLPKETNIGILIGKLNLSVNLLDSKIPKNIIDDDSSSVYLRMKHAIAVCGFNVQKPVTKEAVVLFESFRSDYNIVEAIDFIQQDSNKGDFTSYDSIGKKRYFKK